MDFKELEVWLKTSVAGIVILGALGSALFVVAIKCLNYLFGRLLPNSWRGLLGFYIRSFKMHKAYVAELVERGEVAECVLYTVYLFASLVLSGFLMLFCVTGLLGMRLDHEEQQLFPKLYYVIIVMLCAYRMGYNWLKILAAWNQLKIRRKFYEVKRGRPPLFDDSYLASIGFPISQEDVVPRFEGEDKSISERNDS